MDNEYFNSRYSFDPRRDGVWREVARWLQRDVPANAALLELGAGYCSFVNHIVAERKFALDLYDGVREFAADNVEVRIGSCVDLSGWSDESLGVVFASNLFEHLTREDFARTLGEVLRVLKPGGRLLAIQPNYRYCSTEYFDDYTHQLIFTHVGLSEALRASGFRLRRVIPRFLPFSFKSRLPSSPLLTAIYLRLPVRPLAKQMYLMAEKPTTT